jgi:SAM-dependent methyltransferase
VTTVKQHYDELLGPVYSWILGDFETAYENNLALFKTLDLTPAPDSLALDLGSGPGCQAIPLAELGYEVVAIDFCQALLDELDTRARHLPVTTICDDLSNFEQHVASADLVVCMGDTLVHLADVATVERLLARVARMLRPGGRFIATLRDYSGPPPVGGDRFIPIRSSEDQIFTCFLDYRDDVIDVHDLLQERVDGEWQLKVSNYRKLVLDYHHVNQILASEGLAVSEPESAGGMMLLQAVRND